LSEMLLFLHFHQKETKSDEVISMGTSLFPLSLLAFLNIAHGIICRGSPLRLFAALIGFIQLHLLASKMDHEAAFLGNDSWYLVLSPSLILAIALFAILVRYLGVFYLQEFGYVNNRRYRLIDVHQV
jgi:hypothetical protein